MSDETLTALIAALNEEIKERKLKAEKLKRELTKPGPWCSREQAMAYFAIPKGRLEAWVKERKVIAKKFDIEDPNSAVRFKTADIERAYEEMPEYHFETKRKNGELK